MGYTKENVKWVWSRTKEGGVHKAKCALDTIKLITARKNRGHFVNTLDY